MPQMTQAELHNLRELIWMEAANFEKFRLYREQSQEDHIRELCDQLLDRSRQHVTALAELLGVERGDSDANE